MDRYRSCMHDHDEESPARHDGSKCQDCGGCAGPQGNRRRLLKALAATGASISLAGCTDLFVFGHEAEPRERPEIGNETEGPDGTDGGEENGGDEQNGGDNGTGENGGENGGDSGTPTHQVTFAKQGETIEVPEDQSLLVAGEEQGWDLPFNCRQGFCGECTARVWGDPEGRVDLSNNQFLEDEEMEDGFVLTCVGFPRSDFVLETGERDALDDFGYR